MPDAPLPHPVGFSRPPQEIASRFLQVEIDRAPDPLWHYRLAVPTNVKLRPKEGLTAPSADAPLQSLGVFYREDAEADLEVYGIQLGRETDPVFWLEELLVFNRFSPQSWKMLPGPGGLLGDAVAAWESEGRAFAGRFVTMKYGDRLFVLACRAPRERYAGIAEDFFFTLTRFTVLRDTRGATAEGLVPVGSGGPFPWRLELPASWEVRSGPAEARKASFQAELRPPDTSDRRIDSAWRPFPGSEGLVIPDPLPVESYRGRLSVTVVGASEFDDAADAGRACVAAFREAGIEPETDRFAPGPKLPAFSETWDLTAAARHQGQEGFEARCRVSRFPRGWMLLNLLGLSRPINPFAWMQNRRALDLAGLTFQVPG